MHSQEKVGGVVPSPPPAPLVSPGGGAPLSPSFASLYPFFHARPIFQRLFQRLFQRRKRWKYNDLRRFLHLFHLFHTLFYIYISYKI